MTKICGYFCSIASARERQEFLQAMVGVMQHDSKSNAEQLLVDFGGTALLGISASDESRSAWNSDHSSYLALCGQVVNTVDVTSANTVRTRLDVSALLNAFEHDRQQVLPRLNGVFALTYVDTTNGGVTVANDRYGFMPIYYYHDQHRFVFASETKAILRVIDQRDMDWEACADFFYAGSMIGSKTLFKGIHALEPGETLDYRDQQLHKSKYYDFRKTPVMRPEDVSTTRLAALFTEAVRRRIDQNKPNTVLLSGGFDSRLILGTLHTLQVKPKIVTLEHANEKGGADGQYAAQIAQELGLECDFRPSRKDFLSSGSSLEVFYILDGMIPTWRLFIGEVYQELDVGLGAVWEGVGLGSALGGSHQGSADPQENLAKMLGERKMYRWLLRTILTPRLFRRMDKHFMRRITDELAAIPPSENQFLHFVLSNRIRRRIATNPYQLYASKVEPITPGMDLHFMDYVLGIPLHLRRKHKLYIDLLKKEFAFLTQVPVISGGGVYTFDSDTFKAVYRTRTERVRRALSRAAKVVKWFSGKYVRNSYRMTEDYESASLIIATMEIKNFERPIYNKRLLRKLFAMYRNGNGLYHRLFTVVFYIELWHLLFIDADSPMLFKPENFEQA